jgi:hypothetical protein
MRAVTPSRSPFAEPAHATIAFPAVEELHRKPGPLGARADRDVGPVEQGTDLIVRGRADHLHPVAPDPALARGVRREDESRVRHPGADAREAPEEEREVLVAVEVPGVADAAVRRIAGRGRAGVVRRGRRRDPEEPILGDAAPAEDLAERLAHRDAEVRAARHLGVDDAAQPRREPPRERTAEVARKLVPQRVVPVIHDGTPGEPADEEPRDRGLVVVRVDHVDAGPVDRPPEPRDERDVAREPSRPRARRDGADVAVRHEVDLVAAARHAVGDLAEEDLRAAEIGIRAREDERDAHQGSR